MSCLRMKTNEVQGCECADSTCGTASPMPGIIISAAGHVERCDVCRRYESDLDAAERLGEEAWRRWKEKNPNVDSNVGAVRHYVEGYEVEKASSTASAEARSAVKPWLYTVLGLLLWTSACAAAHVLYPVSWGWTLTLYAATPVLSVIAVAGITHGYEKRAIQAVVIGLVCLLVLACVVFFAFTEEARELNSQEHEAQMQEKAEQACKDLAAKVGTSARRLYGQCYVKGWTKE